VNGIARDGHGMIGTTMDGFSSLIFVAGIGVFPGVQVDGALVGEGGRRDGATTPFAMARCRRRASTGWR